MSHKLTFLRPSPAMVVACLALFIAIGGVSVAAVKLKANAVKTKHIADAAVTTTKVAPAAIDSVRLADNSVSTPKLADGAVTTPKIADRAVTGPKLAPGSVGAAQVSATGTASNSASYTLATDQCTQVSSFEAPGIRDGDIVALNAVPNNQATYSVSLGDGVTAVPNRLTLEICNRGAAKTFTPGSLLFTWVAFR